MMDLIQGQWVIGCIVNILDAKFDPCDQRLKNIFVQTSQGDSSYQ